MLPTQLPAQAYWLALAWLRGTPLKTKHRWLSAIQMGFSMPHPSAAEQVLRQSLSHQATKAAILDIDWTGIEAELAQLEGHQQHWLCLCDADYPMRLRELEQGAPLVLFVHGDVAALQHPQLAMVGSRNPSAQGEHNAYQFAQALTEQGLTISSGLALGIDAASHRGAMSSGGQTIAVMATGLDRIYPRQHQALAEDIIEHGALVTEFPRRTPIRRHQFPQRNRLISGLSLGTFVVEGALSSGSLITAQYALRQNREVFALPGSLHNPLAKGAHSLIKQGAKLVDHLDDILNELKGLCPDLSSRLASNKAPILRTPPSNSVNIKPNSAANALHTPIPTHPDYGLLLKHLADFPQSIDVLALSSGLTPGRISSMLLDLELAGAVDACSGGKYILPPNFFSN